MSKLRESFGIFIRAFLETFAFFGTFTLVTAIIFAALMVIADLIVAVFGV